jgi:hypothetical protein
MFVIENLLWNGLVVSRTIGSFPLMFFALKNLYSTQLDQTDDVQ